MSSPIKMTWSVNLHHRASDIINPASGQYKNIREKPKGNEIAFSSTIYILCMWETIHILSIYSSDKKLFNCDAHDQYIVVRFVRLFIGFGITDVLYNINALGYSTKHRVFIVQPRCGHYRDEELRPVRVGAGVGHRHRVRTVVFECRVELILKLFPPNGLPAGSVPYKIVWLNDWMNITTVTFKIVKHKEWTNMTKQVDNIRGQLLKINSSLMVISPQKGASGCISYQWIAFVKIWWCSSYTHWLPKIYC